MSFLNGSKMDNVTAEKGEKNVNFLMLVLAESVKKEAILFFFPKYRAIMNTKYTINDLS